VWRRRSGGARRVPRKAAGTADSRRVVSSPDQAAHVLCLNIFIILLQCGSCLLTSSLCLARELRRKKAIACSTLSAVTAREENLGVLQTWQQAAEISRIPESQHGWGWQGPLWVPQPNPLPKQGHPEQAAQHRVHAGLEYLQRRR